MSKGKHAQSSSDGVSVAEQIAQLRDQINLDTANWPATAVGLTNDLYPPSGEAGIGDHMLTFMVNAVLSGIDLPKQYPKFYTRLLSDATLRQEFLDLLMTLEEPDLAGYSELPPPDLSFLPRKSAASPQVRFSRIGQKVQVAFLFIQDQLSQSVMPDLVFRSDTEQLLDDRSRLLATHQFELEDNAWQLSLEAVPNEAGQMDLLLIANPADDEMIMPTVEATITWGDYVATAVCDEWGQAHFPPLFIDSDTLTHDLDLRLLVSSS